MQLVHTFTMRGDTRQAFAVLRDIERIAPCMPGASVTEINGDEFSGRVRVKVGPIQVTYQGSARFVEVDEEQLRAVIEARGKEERGQGTARATITAQLQPAGPDTEVRVTTDLAITGRPAQFGRGIMADVGDKLLSQFAACVGEQLSHEAADMTAAAATAAPAPPVSAGSPGSPGSREPEAPSGSPQQPDAVDLVAVAGGAVLKRVVPVVVAVAVAAVVWRLATR